MLVRGHLTLSALLWAQLTPRALEALGLPPLDPGALVASTLLAGSLGAWPDIDCPAAAAANPDEGVSYGSLVAMAHGPASEGVAVLVHQASGGHRHATHWASTCLALAAVLVLPSLLWPVVTLATVLGIVAAWPARAFLVRDWFGAALLGGAAGVASAVLVAPRPWLLPVAAAFGGLAHLLGDMIPKGSGVPLFGLPLPTKGRGRLARAGRRCRRRIGPGRWGLFTIGGKVERKVVTPLLGLATVLTLVHALVSTSLGALAH